jgi:hypothetical protein
MSRDSAHVPQAAVYMPNQRGFVATEMARGPWNPDAQHGGAPAALLVRALERCEPVDGLVLARVTYEFLRPVRLGQLSVEASVIRAGRRARWLEGSVLDASGLEVVRARALQVAAADPGRAATPEAERPPGPEAGSGPDVVAPHGLPMFAPDAIEIRFVSGRFGGGPATAWFRLRVPLVAGEAPTPLQRLAAAGDFGNGISAVLSWEEYLFINPDLTLYLERPPAGAWICLQSETRLAPGGVGLATSTLFDEAGWVGHATQSLVVAPRR